MSEWDLIGNPIFSVCLICHKNRALITNICGYNSKFSAARRDEEIGYQIRKVVESLLLPIMASAVANGFRFNSPMIFNLCQRYILFSQSL